MPAAKRTADRSPRATQHPSPWSKNAARVKPTGTNWAHRRERQFEIFTPDALPAIWRLLREAKAKAGDDELILERIEYFASAFKETIALFYATRFPKRRITISDRGISGDTATGAVARFDQDIAPCKPTVSTIMLGLNDIGRDLYGRGTPRPDVARRRPRPVESRVSRAEPHRNSYDEVRFVGSELGPTNECRERLTRVEVGLQLVLRALS